MVKFAEKTTVPVEKTRMEIQETLRKYGADQYQSADDWATGKVVIRFRCQKRYVQYSLQMPLLKSYRSAAAHAQAERSTWRALLRIIQAKLIAIDAGVSTFEEEFLAHVVVPDGRTVAELIRPQLAMAYEKGDMPNGLLALPNYSGEQ